MKNEFVLAFNEVLEEKGLPKEVVLEAIEAAMVSAYRRAVNASNAQLVEANIDAETGQVAIFAEKEVVENVQDERTEVSLEAAREVDVDTSVGEMVVVETTPQNFGRVAAQTARQVIQQRIREAEREAQMNHFGQQLGEIVNGVVQAVNSQAVTLGLDMKAEGIMPRNQQIPGERFRVHDRVRALLLEVKTTSRGPQIILSRAHRNFLRRLMENEVPEIYQGVVEIRSIAREPGHRSKVAVAALQAGVDPVGACVGIRGVRIQAIVRELSDEKIDVIEWNNDPIVYIAKALSPARVIGVFLDEYTKRNKTATVVVPEDQLSLAIGRDGQNARLAAKLTSWRIDIKSLPEAAVDAIFKLKNDPEFAELAEQEAEVLPQIENVLTKKAERRPVTPEEYQVLGKFVERVEHGLIQQRKEEREAEEERRRITQASIPEAAYDITIEESGISLRFCNILGGAGYTTVGDLMLQTKLDPDVVLALEGIGPKAMEEIEDILANIKLPEPEEKIEPGAAYNIPVEESGISLRFCNILRGAGYTTVGDLMRQMKLDPDVILALEGIGPKAMEEIEYVLANIEISEPEEKAEAVVAGALTLVDEAVTDEPDQVEVSLDKQVEGVEPEPLKDAEVVEQVHEEPIAEVDVTEVLEVAAGEVTETLEDEPASFDKLFTLQPSDSEMIEPVEDDEDEEESKKKKKKKRKKYVEMEYDPDKDVVVVKKKRKRAGTDDWEEKWDL